LYHPGHRTIANFVAKKSRRKSSTSLESNICGMSYEGRAKLESLPYLNGIEKPCSYAGDMTELGLLPKKQIKLSRVHR